jgi:hypothetical protein
MNVSSDQDNDSPIERAVKEAESRLRRGSDSPVQIKPMSSAEAAYRLEELESRIVGLMTRDEPNNIVIRELAEKTKLALEYYRGRRLVDGIASTPQPEPPDNRVMYCTFCKVVVFLRDSSVHQWHEMLPIPGQDG